MIELRDGIFAHPAGCLWHPASGTLFAADLHLGYAWAQLRRGELAPPVAGDTAERLLAVLAELGPQELVLLGDIVHAPYPAPEEWAVIESALERFSAAAGRVTLVAGNHDRGFSRACVSEWNAGGVLALHGHRLPASATRASSYCIYGHWHPAVTLRDAAGAHHKLKAFVATESAVVLPAFTSFSTGLNLRKPWPSDLREALGEGRARAWVMTGRSLRGPFSVG